MALEKIIKPAIEIGKKGLKEGLDGLKEGKGFSESLKGGFETVKESAFKELDKFLSPESQNELTESAKKLDTVDQTITKYPESVKENPAEEVKDVNDVTKNVNKVSNQINENFEPSFLSDIKKGLEDFKAVLTQIQEVQDKLKELGVSPDLLTMLSAEAMDIEEMDELEEGEGSE
ncbi:hypothetical protein [Gelidibacter pelagius]|uniref:Uncharacterized protein n=1 Tax=Gelidibacter pelagius TaxID=2819985 RepID=A0ABS3SQ51_9FLAO|nr:hypothetical protein [Gelidibacter pelagius]MBO3097824.1 hypothetical protein [Gelidibacter pelagius]